MVKLVLILVSAFLVCSSGESLRDEASKKTEKHLSQRVKRNDKQTFTDEEQTTQYFHNDPKDSYTYNEGEMLPQRYSNYEIPQYEPGRYGFETGSRIGGNQNLWNRAEKIVQQQRPLQFIPSFQNFNNELGIGETPLRMPLWRAQCRPKPMVINISSGCIPRTNEQLDQRFLFTPNTPMRPFYYRRVPYGLPQQSQILGRGIETCYVM